MAEAIQKKVTLQRRAQIEGNGVWLSRDGNQITISYDYAGRFSKEDAYFSARDIETLAQFVADTNDQVQP